MREKVLDEAKKIVTGSRHGAPEDTFGAIALLWSAYLDRLIFPHDVAIMMLLLKVGRASNGALEPCLDNYIDMAGYAACAAELADIAAAQNVIIKK